MPLHRCLAATCCLALLCVLIAGCGLGGGGVEARAAAYYNFMVGRSPKTPYTTFLSPAYKATFQRATLDALDDFSRREITPNERYPAAQRRDVLVEVRDRFAYTSVDPSLGDAFANLSPQRWVRVGRHWYLYLGSDAEAQAYGVFPPDLYPPYIAPRGDDPARSLPGE